MKKTILLLYSILILFTLVGLFVGNANYDSLQLLIQGGADPFVWMLFMFLGIFPLGFLLYGYKHYVLKPIQIFFLVLGLGLGGFSLTHAFYEKPIKKSTGKWINLIVLALLILSIILLGYGLILGNFSLYLDQIETDNFIYVMTLDFIFQWALSVLLTKRIYKHYQLSYIPLIGFLFVLFNED